MSTGEHDDLERDAWLSQALRHAPDADAAPPPALRETILRTARAAAAPARVGASSLPPTSPLRRLALWWAWLARPPVAAGFASVMVATLVGLIWWDQPIDRTVARAPTPATSSTAERAAAGTTAPVAAPTPTAEPPRVARDGPGSGSGSAPAPAATPADKKLSARASGLERPNRTSIADAASPPRADRHGAPAASPPPSTTAKSRDALADAAAPAPREPAPSQAATSRSEPAPFPERRVAETEASPPPTAPVAAAPPPGADNARSAGDAPALASAGAAVAAAPQRLAKAGAPSTAVSSAGRLRADVATAPATPLAALLASIAAQPLRWSWQRSGAAQPMNQDLPVWLTELERASATRWRADTAPRAGPGDSSAPALRLFRDGELRATLRIAAEDVLLTAPGSAPLRAALPASTQAELQHGLDAAAP